jgi:hypothetical protein
MDTYEDQSAMVDVTTYKENPRLPPQALWVCEGR